MFREDDLKEKKDSYEKMRLIQEEPIKEMLKILKTKQTLTRRVSSMSNSNLYCKAES